MLYSKSELSRILAAMNEEVGATELLEQIVKYLDQDILEDMVKFIDEEVFTESSFFDVTQPEEGETEPGLPPGEPVAGPPEPSTSPAPPPPEAPAAPGA